jgi:hypothetical protein
LFGGNPRRVSETIVGLEPVLATALICTIVFRWLCWRGSVARAAIVALIAACSTILWPYAYIGLETTQSLFLLLAGYLSIASGSPASSLQLLAFGVSAGIAVSAKATGAFLLPAVLFLLYCQRERLVQAGSSRVYAKLLAFAATPIGLFFLLGSSTKPQAWLTAGGFAGFRNSYLVDGPLVFGFQFVSLLFSANKGLLLYCPPLLMSLTHLRRAFREDFRVASFAVLVLLGQMLGFASMVVWADETWGPRYLHCSVAPLMIVIGLSPVLRRSHVRLDAALLVLVLLGGYFNFLGSAFYYGSLFKAASEITRLKLEHIQHDISLNHIRFNSKLLRDWLDDQVDQTPKPHLWSPPSHDWFPKPELPPDKGVDLAPYAYPQPGVLRLLARPGLRSSKLACAYGAALVLSSLCLVLLYRCARRTIGSNGS